MGEKQHVEHVVCECDNIASWQSATQTTFVMLGRINLFWYQPAVTACSGLNWWSTGWMGCIHLSPRKHHDWRQEMNDSQGYGDKTMGRWVECGRQHLCSYLDQEDVIQFRDDPEPLNLKQTTAAATLLYVVIDPIYSGFNILYIIFYFVATYSALPP